MFIKHKGTNLQVSLFLKYKQKSDKNRNNFVLNTSILFEKQDFVNWENFFFLSVFNKNKKIKFRTSK